VLTLRELAGMVREDELAAATVQIDARAQVLHRPRATLDVPPRPPRPPRARPRRLARLLRLPEHEVERVLLARIIWSVAALIGSREPRIVADVAGRRGQCAKPRVALRAEVDPAVALVGVPCGQERLDPRDHLGGFLAS